MTSRQEREAAKATRDDVDDRARGLGHTMTWALSPNATRKGYAYFFEGRCGDCGGEASAGASWSFCGGIRDARNAECGGPGTAVLTEIEAGRFGELVADAVWDFGRAVRDERDTDERRAW